MRKYLFFVLLTAALFTGSVTYAQVPWKAEVPLSWSDFTGFPDESSPYIAFTYYNLSYRSSWDGGGTITITVQCIFEKNKSWRKIEKKLTPEVLLHEQMHFNIAELYARRMRQAFADYTAVHKHSAETSADIKKIFATCMDNCKAYNELYDLETSHSVNEPRQQEWNKKITAQLTELSAYALK